MLHAQVAAAAQPQDLGKRQRKKVSYNEANLARNKTASPSDSEYSGSDAVEDDEDGSSSGLELEGEEGKKVSYAPPKGKQRQGLSSHHVLRLGSTPDTEYSGSDPVKDDEDRSISRNELEGEEGKMAGRVRPGGWMATLKGLVN